MEISVKFVFVFVVLGLFGTAQCDEEGGEISGIPPPYCPLPPDIGKQRRIEILRDDVMQCVFATNRTDIKALMENTNGTAEIQEAAKYYCSLSNLASGCLDFTIKQGETCLNNTDEQILKLTADFYRKFYEIWCKNDQHHFVDIVKAVKKMYVEELIPTNRVIDLCLKEATSPFGNDDASHYDPSSFSSAQYSIVKGFKKCINERLEVGDSMLGALEPFLQEILNVMTCIGADDQPTPCEVSQSA